MSYTVLISERNHFELFSLPSSYSLQIFAAHTREVVASHQIEITNIYPQEGWVEQDPKEILTAVKDCIDKAAEILRSEEVEPSDIVAIGITNQRETTVVWDAITGEPLHNAIGNKT
jgi:glycerol kinase